MYHSHVIVVSFSNLSNFELLLKNACRNVYNDCDKLEDGLGQVFSDCDKLK